ncbi:MAG: response regulator transcription factor [Solirubrobacteraceae bacterium]|jgi:DNA-binding NarL/FixJ family response regulator
MRTIAASDTVAHDEIEVIVIDDHLGMRKGLELLLRQEGLRVAGVAGALEEARALLARRRHDVALVDIHLGADNALGLVEERLRSDPQAAIVLYTGYAEGLADAARIGARGFVLKSSPAAHLIAALRIVAHGGHYVDPNLAVALAENASTARLSVLSPREMQILDLLADGLNGQAIAKHLFLSPETVRTHVRNATTKLGAHTRVQAVALVVGGRAGR